MRLAGGRGAARPGQRPRPGAARQQPDAPPADQERDREPEDDFSDSWHSYRERADHLRQTYGWRVPAPPPRAEDWLPLGRDDDQEHDSGREDR